MKQGLALARATVLVAGATVVHHLSSVSAKGKPALDLALIIWVSSAKVVSAVPVKPASRVVFVKPAFLSPFC